MPHRGTTAENPTVGAIVVSSEGVVVGRGVTARGGRPHAETIALDMAGPAAHGATLYVTLEPCAHWGKTPPCADAVMAAGIARVVCGLEDPDPRTAGASLNKLSQEGIDVVCLSPHAPSRTLHDDHLSRLKRRRPFVTLKLAVSRDGMIGRRDTGNVAITGEEARRWTHMQRALTGAVLVGAGTAIADHPRLSVRLAGLEDRQPVPVILAGSRPLPQDLNLLGQDSPQTIVIAAQTGMRTGSADLLSVNGNDGWPDLPSALTALADRGIGSLLVEGGAGLSDALLDANLVDRFHLLQSETDVGPEGIPATRHGSLIERLGALGFTAVDRRTLGCDRLTTFERA